MGIVWRDWWFRRPARFPVAVAPAGSVRDVPTALTGAPDTRLAAARFVAEHWREAALRSPWTDQPAAVAHPLNMVLAALDGETDPNELGIWPGDHEEFRKAINDTKEQHGSR